MNGRIERRAVRPVPGGLFAGGFWGTLFSLPLWIAILVLAFNFIRAAEHYSRWAWMAH